MRAGAGEYRERVVILTRELASPDATGEEAESWPTPQPLGTGEHWAKFDGAGAGETADAPRQSFGTVALRFRHAVTLKAVDRVRLKEDGRVFVVAGVRRERAPWGGWQTACELVGDSTPDADAPALESATVAASGLTLTLVFSEEVTATAFTGFTLDATFGAVTATYSSGDGSDTIVFSLSRTIDAAETVTLDYTPGTVRDWAANTLAAISDEAVTNGSAQADGFDPDTIADLEAYYTAGAENFTDEAGTTPAADGQTVARVNDRSGNARYLTQATAGNRPTLALSGGEFRLTYDGAGDRLAVASASALNGGAGGLTVVVHGKLPLPASQQFFFGKFDSAQSSWMLRDAGSNRNVQFIVTTSAGDVSRVAVLPSVTTGDFTVIAWYDPDADVIGARNVCGAEDSGEVTTACPNPPQNGTDPLAFGTAGFAGTIIRGLVYSRCLTSTERDLLVDWLQGNL